MTRGKNNALSIPEIDIMNEELKAGNHLYPADGRRENVSAIVDAVCSDVAEVRDRVDLRDSRTVRQIVKDYIESCSRIGILPSKSGLSRALGYSRKGLYLYCRDHPNDETARFLEIAFDSFSEALDIAASGGTVHPIFAIWIAKSQYNQRDNLPLEEPKRERELPDIRDLMSRIYPEVLDD